MNDSIVIRQIEQLNLRPEIEKLVRELMIQIDMPVVFEVNFQGEGNFGGRHPENHNQFWIKIRPQEEPSEFERLILYLLYMGVLERKRVVCPQVLDTYREMLEQIPDEEMRRARIKNCIGTLNGLVSFAKTMEAHMYLKAYGIETSERVKRRKFEFIQKSLKEYLSIQKKQPGFIWHDETALNNIIDVARTCWLNRGYHNRIWNLLRRTRPREKAAEYTRQLNELVEMLHRISKEYEEDPEMDAASAILEQSFDILGMKKMAKLKKDYNMRREYIDRFGNKTMRCAFVPKNIPRKEDLIRGLRYLNSGLILVEEYYRYHKNVPVPDPHVNLVITEEIQAWADGNKEKGYQISVTTGLILMLSDEAKKADLHTLGLESCLLLFPEEEVRDRLYRYALYYVVVHEYVHVLHGDCDKTAKDEEERLGWEENANKGASYLVGIQLPYQYRPLTDDKILEEQRFMKNLACDQLIFMAAQKWCDKLTGKI